MASRGLSLVRTGQAAIGNGYRSTDVTVTTVADVMSHDVTAIRRETPVYQAARILLERGLPGEPRDRSRG